MVYLEACFNAISEFRDFAAKVKETSGHKWIRIPSIRAGNGNGVARGVSVAMPDSYMLWSLFEAWETSQTDQDRRIFQSALTAMWMKNSSLPLKLRSDGRYYIEPEEASETNLVDQDAPGIDQDWETISDGEKSESDSTKEQDVGSDSDEEDELGPGSGESEWETDSWEDEEEETDKGNMSSGNANKDRRILRRRAHKRRRGKPRKD